MILKRYKKLSQWEKIRWWLQSNQRLVSALFESKESGSRFEMFISGALCASLRAPSYHLYKTAS